MFSGENLVVRDLNVRYNGAHVVQSVSFAARPGEVFGLLGPSGAGKSSVLGALSGITPADGSIRYGELDVSRLPARGRRFGHVYQDFRLFDWMSIWDNVAFPCRALNWPHSDMHTAVAELLARVGLLVPFERLVRDLSGGERQRVALARALVFRPRALLLDEPFSHLDPPLREELKRDLVKFLQQTQVPVVLVTHDHTEAFELCDRVGIMIEGALVQVGHPADLLAWPASLEVARLLSFTNSLDGVAEQVHADRVDLLIDGMVRSLKGRAPIGSVATNDRIRVVCRPERVGLLGTDSDEPNSLVSRVISCHALADATLVTVDVMQSRQWSLSLPGQISISTGQEVLSHVLPDDLMVYPLRSS